MDYKQYYPDIVASYSSLVTTKEAEEILGLKQTTVQKLKARDLLHSSKVIFGLVHYDVIKLDEVLRILFLREHGDPDIESKLIQFYQDKLKGYPDLITVHDISKITGYAKSTINSWIQSGHLKIIRRYDLCKKNHVPKEWLIQYLSGHYYNTICRKSQKHREIIKKYPSSLYREMIMHIQRKQKDYCSGWQHGAVSRRYIMKTGILIYNSYADRYDIRFGLEEYYGGLHCGNTFEVLIENRWIPSRIKKAEEWYLIGIKTKDIQGLQVRI